ncbi:MAG: sigma-70 family RNA polymerase sigma factor [Acidobacteriota bacterium]
MSEALLACHAALYRYARSLCREAAVAEDLVQETYRRALAARRPPAIPTQEHVRPWMFTILRHLWQNELRHRSHDPLCASSALLIDPPRPETPEAVLTRKMIRSEVHHALEALPEIYREVVVLRELESMSYAEIAVIVQCPVGTVMSRLARGRALLRELLVKLDAGVREVPR